MVMMLQHSPMRQRSSVVQSLPMFDTQWTHERATTAPPLPSDQVQSSSTGAPWGNVDWASSMLMNEGRGAPMKAATSATVTTMLAKYYPRSTHNHTLPITTARQHKTTTITQLIDAVVQCLQIISMHDVKEDAAPPSTSTAPPRPSASIHHLPLSHLSQVQHTVGRALVAVVCALNERLCTRMLDALEVHRGAVFADFDRQQFNADNFYAAVEQFVAEQTRCPLHQAVKRRADDENNSVGVQHLKATNVVSIQMKQSGSGTTNTATADEHTQPPSLSAAELSAPLCEHSFEVSVRCRLRSHPISCPCVA